MTAKPGEDQARSGLSTEQLILLEALHVWVEMRSRFAHGWTGADNVLRAAALLEQCWALCGDRARG